MDNGSAANSVTRPYNTMQGLWFASIGLAFLQIAIASMRFTAMQGIYPLELELFIRHVLSTVAMTAVAVYLIKSHRDVFCSHVPALGAILSVVFCVCIIFSYSVGELAGTITTVAEIIEEAVSALLLVLWACALIPHGFKKIICVIGFAACAFGLLQLSLCWLQYVPHLVFVATMPLASAGCLALFARQTPQTGSNTEIVCLARYPYLRPLTPLNRIAVLVSIFCLTFLAGYIIYAALESQESMTGSPFAEISMGIGNILGGIFILVLANHLEYRSLVGAVLFISMAACALTFYFMSALQTTTLLAGVFLAISSFIMRPAAILLFVYVFSASERSTHMLVAGFCIALGAKYFARCFSGAFMVFDSASMTAYGIAAGISIILTALCWPALMRGTTIDAAPGAAFVNGADALPHLESAVARLREQEELPKPLPEEDALPLTQKTEAIRIELLEPAPLQTAENILPDDEPHVTPFRSAIDTLAQEALLTQQERNVLFMLAQGRNAKSIADTMVLSSNTVRTHMRNVYAKVNVHSQQELIELVDARVASIRDSEI
ncbi:MAG: hypothetical protein IKE43_13110 [Coriobacteriales bacterium]|nr:hypothetical protein [Coriobacteriales bacterium]